VSRLAVWPREKGSRSVFGGLGSPGSSLAVGIAVAVALAIPVLAQAPAAGRGVTAPDGTFDVIWKGAAQIEKRHTSVCGTLTETRVSPLLARPLVLRGTFCLAGTDRFRLDYTEPEAVRIIYSAGTLSVTTDGGRTTEAFDVGTAVKRTRDYFGGPGAKRNLEHDFSIQAAQTPEKYTLVLSAAAGRIARSVSRIAVDLEKTGFLPTRLEIRGKSGVTSTFDIRVTALDGAIDPGRFVAPKPTPKPGRGGQAPQPGRPAKF